MSDTIDAANGEHASLMTEVDEVSLADARSLQTDDSVADTLDVRSDAIGIMQNSTAPFRRPAMLAGAALAAGLAVLIIGGILGRGVRRNGIPSVEA